VAPRRRTADLAEVQDLPEGANSLSTGLLEQRLTPEGVELMRSEAIAALSSGDPEHCGPEGYYDVHSVIVVGRWADSHALSDDNQHLARVMDPWSWLPATAWEDPEIRAYVPSTYFVRITGDSPDFELDQEVIAQLPAAAADLIDANLIDANAFERQLGVVKFTIEEARAFAAALDDAGLEQDELLNAYQLDYQFDYLDESGDTVVHIVFGVFDLEEAMFAPATPPGT
jgi:hypothetical protein